MFYRVEYEEYEEKGDKLDENKKRDTAKKYIEGDGKEFLVSTSVADTTYIRNVIDVFVQSNTSKEKINQLYHEPGEGYQ